jgi:hypothetical protein
MRIAMMQKIGSATALMGFAVSDGLEKELSILKNQPCCLRFWLMADESDGEEVA